MKRIMIFVAMLLIPLLVNAETVIKIGTMVTYGKVEEARFTLPGAEIKFEQSFYKGLGIGIGIRKETRWAYSGYYFSLYPTYKMKLSKNRFVAASLGAEYGLASSEYERYSTTYDESGNLTAHKWIYLIQNVPVPGDKVKGNTGILYPFTTISFGTRIGKKVAIEAGLKIQMLKFGIKSCSFDPQNWQAYNIVEKKTWAIIPSIQISIGYRLF